MITTDDDSSPCSAIRGLARPLPGAGVARARARSAAQLAHWPAPAERRVDAGASEPAALVEGAAAFRLPVRRRHAGPRTHHHGPEVGRAPNDRRGLPGPRGRIR